MLPHLPQFDDEGARVAARYEIARSPRWKSFASEYLARHPHCVACGPHRHRHARKHVHHIFPFHFCVALGRPELELDARNLITLCASGPNHHLLLGHFEDYESCNLLVERHARFRFHRMSMSRILSNRHWELLALMRLPHLTSLSPRDDRVSVRRSAFLTGGDRSRLDGMDGTREVWTKRVADWRASGLDAASFAGKHGLKEASLKWWKWQLARERKRARKKAGGAKRATPISPLTFVEMTSRAVARGEFEVVLANGTRIHVAAGFDPVALSRLLDVLERRK